MEGDITKLNSTFSQFILDILPCIDGKEAKQQALIMTRLSVKLAYRMLIFSELLLL